MKATRERIGAIVVETEGAAGPTHADYLRLSAALVAARKAQVIAARAVVEHNGNRGTVEAMSRALVTYDAARAAMKAHNEAVDAASAVLDGLSVRE